MSPLLVKYGSDSNRFLQIKFVGGPYDGHIEVRYSSVRSLPLNVVLLVIEEAFELPDEKDEDYRDPVGKMLTSVALYSLQRVEGENLYRFKGSISIDQLKRALAES